MDLNGVLHVGRFGGVHPVKRKDGSVVDGLCEVRVRVETPDGETVTYRSSFFDEYDGSPTAMARCLSEVAPKEGEEVAIRVRARVKDGYLNWSALRIARLSGTAALKVA